MVSAALLELLSNVITLAMVIFFGQGDNHQLSISLYEPLCSVGEKARHMWHVEEGAKKGKPGLDQDGV